LFVSGFSQTKAVSRDNPPYKEYALKTVDYVPEMYEKESNGMKSPSLRVYLPSAKEANGKMVILLPGGGYRGLALDREGYDWAPFFLDRGFAVGVLKYRMPEGHNTVPMTDVKAAFDLVKSNAKDWHINKDSIGIMGSSAGGHLASTYATHTEKEDRPAFQILLYPVITMDIEHCHRGSRDNLLGENPSEGLVSMYSNEKRVDDNTPKAFIIFAADDKVVPPINGLMYVNALIERGIPVTFLLYPKGGHGFGFNDSFIYKKEFLMELSRWLEE
jgi:acetyl esterase/lipase